MKKIQHLMAVIMLFMSLIFYRQTANAAIDQILSDNFFLNPAELSLTKKAQLSIGNLFAAPKLKFTGATSLGLGSATSKVNNSLPYLLGAYRFSNRFVMGLTVTPSAYGHIQWPIDSLLREISTTTKLVYYRIGAQSSYQFTNKLSLGVGLNLEYNKLAELDFVIPNKGNQINKVSGTNYTGDIGLFYKLNPRNYLSLVLYTQVNTYGHGTSTLGPISTNNFAMNITEASVASIGMQHWVNDDWLLEGKVYWSGWSIEKKITLINTTTGNSVSPTNWKDTWSFQVFSRLKTTEKLALLGSFTYETNPVPLPTNSVGYPISPVGSIAAGIDVALRKGFSTQLIYSYGAFTPKAKINYNINNLQSYGSIKGYFQGIALQGTFKI